MEHDNWPRLDLREWEPTYLTLHRWLQIVGKVRLALCAPLNHWWHVAFYVTPRGLTTSSIPCPGHTAQLTFDFVAHELLLERSDGRSASLALEPMSVSEFFARTRSMLKTQGIDCAINAVPAEVTDRTPFDVDVRHASYDREQVERVHRILVSADGVFNRYRSRFVGKSSPVHLFWGAFDLAVTRFSGRVNPNPPSDRVMGPAYSHEVISHGFWPGGDWPNAGRVEEAVFYGYAVPQPAGLPDARVCPDAARYDAKLGEFILPYDVVRTSADPDATLLEFMESTYAAAADRAKWPRPALELRTRVGVEFALP